MTEGQIQGKRFWDRNNGEFEITELELAGFNVTYNKMEKKYKKSECVDT